MIIFESARAREGKRQRERGREEQKEKKKRKKKKKTRRNIKLRSACWSALNYMTMSMHMKNGKTT